MRKGNGTLLPLIWVAAIIAVVASTATLVLSDRGEDRHWVSESEYQRIQRYARLDAVRETLMTDYYQPLDEDELITGAIRGMTSAVGDVYTFYYTPDEMKRETDENDGHYDGIGVVLERNREGYIELVRVYPGTPAETAGLRVGDRIVSVDGAPVDAATYASYLEGVQRMRGPDGAEVVLGVLRDGQTLEFPLTRAAINVSYAEYTILDGDIGYVSISQFTGDAADRFGEAIDAFRAADVRGMVIDLRNDPGGLLTHVVSIADKVLPEGLIVYIEDRNGNRTNYFSDAEYLDVPLAVLVNGMSASASEILASAVQALDRGTVVCLQTYGKGVVQNLTTFPEDGSGMQYTTASYFDANGRSINGVGVTPDIEVPLEADRVPFDPDPASDNQIAAAIEALGK